MPMTDTDQKTLGDGMTMKHGFALVSKHLAKQRIHHGP